VTLEGIEADTPFASSSADEPSMPAFSNESAPKRDAWGTPDYLKPEGGRSTRQNTRQQPSNSKPVSVTRGQSTRRQDVWIPKHNQAWETDSTDEMNPSNSMNPDDEMPPQLAGMHRVQPGDTLTGIASHYLGSSNRYVKSDANRDTLKTRTTSVPECCCAFPRNALGCKPDGPSTGPEA
jgi:hypothetical protein